MSVENAIKGLAALVGLAGFVFGVVKFLQVQAVAAETPYLERKLAWCEQAVETASRIAVAEVPAEEDITRFWQMYWGVMGLIERESITAAMVDFGDSLNKQTTEGGTDKGGKADPTGLGGKSLALAHACRAELSAEWSPSWALSP
ncbi:MAG: hypothetical protein AAF919_10035 [Pseudomonadota bacterium]